MKIITIFLFALLSFSALAQDKIIKKNGAVIDCKVTEIAAVEVKYYYSENPKLVFGRYLRRCGIWFWWRRI